MVFYRKYRPQRISELDLDSVRAKLSSMLASKELPHAFLFTGPKGLGKTSSARILAKAVNCEKKRSKTTTQLKNDRGIEPCNKCSVCISITNGSNIDVLEIDAASNRGIDEIRELRERIKFAPSSLSKKVYIIDEVHMLTTEAFNALLKTLEEPPEHVIFVLCTTEHWKLPTTIVSRAFHVQFEKPTPQELTRALTRIVSGEKLDIEDSVFTRVFELSDGAFRDAAKILEELCVAANGKKITGDLLEKMYKVNSLNQEAASLLKELSAKDVKSALETLDKLSQNGCDFKIFNEKVVGMLHEALLAKNGLTKTNIIIDRLGISDLQRLVSYFNESYKNIRFSVLPQIPLELAVIKYCVMDQSEKYEKEEKQGTGISNKGGKQTVILSGNEESLANARNSSDKLIRDSSVASDKPQNEINSDINEKGFLRSLIDRVKRDNFSVAGVLRSTRIMRLGDTDIELTTPFKFHGDKLKEAKVQALLDKTASEILGKNVKIVITILDRN